MKPVTQFRFKKFAVWHHKSAMRVGVDGVLIGCWTDVRGVRRILDVGTGCGLIALIMAQRCADSEVIGIDIDSPSVSEALKNVEESPWSDRVQIIEGSFPEAFSKSENHGNFDLIVSNPPYFDSGVVEIQTPRERARHQGELSPHSLLFDSISLLNPDGSVAMVVPFDLGETLESEAESLGFQLIGKCLVRGHRDARIKRILLQWRLLHSDKLSQEVKTETLTMEETPGVPTQEYRDLCKDFYLRF